MELPPLLRLGDGQYIGAFLSTLYDVKRPVWDPLAELLMYLRFEHLGESSTAAALTWEGWHGIQPLLLQLATGTPFAKLLLDGIFFESPEDARCALKKIQAGEVT